jgi:hypothetical protein
MYSGAMCSLKEVDPPRRRKSDALPDQPGRAHQGVGASNRAPALQEVTKHLLLVHPYRRRRIGGGEAQDLVHGWKARPVRPQRLDEFLEASSRRRGGLEVVAIQVVEVDDPLGYGALDLLGLETRVEQRPTVLTRKTSPTPKRPCSLGLRMPTRVNHSSRATDTPASAASSSAERDRPMYLCSMTSRARRADR